MSRNHITKENRIEIRALLTAGKSSSAIARQLGLNPSSISRELKRNITADGRYDPRYANRARIARRSIVNQCHRILSVSQDKQTWDWLTCTVERKIRKQQWSPEQVTGWLKKCHRITVSIQVIYDWIYVVAKHLKVFLHHIRGGYRKSRERYVNKRFRDELKKQRGIELRGKKADSRKYYGHFEGDTIVGKGHSGHIATLVERKSGYLMALIIKRLPSELQCLDEVELEVRRLNLAARFADGVTEQFNEHIRPKYQNSLTLDNGSEMAWYEWIERGTKTAYNPTGIKVFFANPYHSWERGTNENTNGLLRFYFPKDKSFANLTQEDVDAAVKKINNRPRKRLHYRTPREVMRRGGVLL